MGLFLKLWRLSYDYFDGWDLSLDAVGTTSGYFAHEEALTLCHIADLISLSSGKSGPVGDLRDNATDGVKEEKLEAHYLIGYV